ncbi:MAG: peptide chain release factor 1 [Candidatus Altiarchaeales archaeon]|nr:peptide chain release factor 1 [Candidatus Altiarchaeales archaeon]MBD3416313.1 peptide chain release factor 1 [Candidatus Altiarchaeales archaeon]
MDSHSEYVLRKLLNELEGKVGRHTELISVYVPAGYDLNNVMSQLASEQGTATNIKSKATRKNVVDALERAMQHLRLYKQTPANGLVLFSGNVSERDGQQDLQVWAFEPPEPISTRLYRCDKNFILDPLKDMIAPKDVYGLIAVDNKEATIATLKGSRYVIQKKLTSGYSGKHRAGGQSARRFERLISEQSHNFKKRIGEMVNEVFLPIIKDVRGLVIGGPAATKEDFVDGDYIHHELKKKIIAVKDITYTDESGIRELINASEEDLREVEMVRQKSLMQRFMKELIEDGLASYGPDLEGALDANAVDTLLMSDKLDDKEVDRLYEKAKQAGSNIEIMNDEFEEGFQLWNTFKGKAAILRYKI